MTPSIRLHRPCSVESYHSEQWWLPSLALPGLRYWLVFSGSPMLFCISLGDAQSEKQPFNTCLSTDLTIAAINLAGQ
jgi:hypothetical protein